MSQPQAISTVPARSALADVLARPWVSFTMRRAGGLLLAFVVIVTITFLIVPLLPGDPALQIAGPDATAAQVEAVRADLGLNRPLWEQYLAYVGGVLRGDLGMSFMWNQPVSDLVFGRLAFTAPLALIAMVIVIIVAVPLGISVAVGTRGGRRRWADSSFISVTGLFSTVPSYVLATLLVVAFAIGLGFFPPAFSRTNPGLSAVLPIVALSIGPICTVARVVRRETETVLEQDFMRTARGWRLPTVVMFARYLIPNILTVTLTLGGLVLTGLLGGAIIVETVFAWPGLGTAIISAIINRDYPLIQGIILVLGMLATVITLLVDVVLGFIDSRTLGGGHV